MIISYFILIFLGFTILSVVVFFHNYSMICLRYQNISLFFPILQFAFLLISKLNSHNRMCKMLSLQNIFYNKCSKFTWVVKVHMMIWISHYIDMALCPFKFVNIYYSLATIFVHPVNVSIEKWYWKGYISIAQVLFQFQRILGKHAHVKANKNSVFSRAWLHKYLL